MKKIAESVCSDISYTKLHHVLKSVGASISKDTVIDYVSLIADAFLVFSVANQFAKSAGRESNPKYYFADNGLLNLFLLQSDGALLEMLWRRICIACVLVGSVFSSLRLQGSTPTSCRITALPSRLPTL
ncbi:ATP-binding protein [Actinobaculum sp. 352]|uniref:DUF4143 domain-containing protein n=1 Tax=Actinobaculum sp. 352 TaxID=2490946 RepID=UPI000D52995B|nr:ATP-binding protein [Actinobaculum sp. 352]AWE42085.1 hypothetical protein DDD63_04170 [Actinobaculum sp. 313]RTE50638.1 ATP-binding protein [Actinobaculum sp. 352]